MLSLVSITSHTRYLIDIIRRYRSSYIILSHSSQITYCIYCPIYMRPITILSNLLLYLLPKHFNRTKVRAICRPIKYLYLIGCELGSGRLCCVYSSAVHLYNTQGKIEQLVGIKIRIILLVVVFIEVLQAWADVILEALSSNIAPFLLTITS